MTDAMVTTDVQTAIDGYFAMWNETDSSRRRRIIEETWTPDGSYVEPLMAASGHDELDRGVAGMQAQYPGCSLRLSGGINSHHDRVRWSWELLGPEDGEPLAGGTNVGVLAPEGRLRQVTGFFDYVPDAA